MTGSERDQSGKPNAAADGGRDATADAGRDVPENDGGGESTGDDDFGFRDRATALAARGPTPATVARWGLGAMLVAAGVHKLVDPAGWTVYVVDWLVPFLVVSPTTFMLANGYLEIAFGAVLLADRYVAFASFVAAVSLAATTAYLAVVWATTGAFGDVVARDVGLTGLALAVLVDAVNAVDPVE